MSYALSRITRIIIISTHLSRPALTSLSRHANQSPAYSAHPAMAHIFGQGPLIVDVPESMYWFGRSIDCSPSSWNFVESKSYTS